MSGVSATFHSFRESSYQIILAAFGYMAQIVFICIYLMQLIIHRLWSYFLGLYFTRMAAVMSINT